MTNCARSNNYTDDIQERIEQSAKDSQHERLIEILLNHMNVRKYAYNFAWFGRPIIQIPQDTVTFQELIWEVRPDLIIETGIAHGGSLVFSASMLALLETFGMVRAPKVIGIDIDIRPDNRAAIESHPAAKWITMLEGSSISAGIVKYVKEIAAGHDRVMVFLDSNHTHEHVLAELRAYAPLVTPGSYCVVLDTGIEDIDPAAVQSGRPWHRGNSPKSALNDYLRTNKNFVLDDFYHEKAWFTSAPAGFIKRLIKDV
jgi:cephalosporin hydroxylase